MWMEDTFISIEVWRTHNDKRLASFFTAEKISRIKCMRSAERWWYSAILSQPPLLPLRLTLSKKSRGRLKVALIIAKTAN